MLGDGHAYTAFCTRRSAPGVLHPAFCTRRSAPGVLHPALLNLAGIVLFTHVFAPGKSGSCGKSEIVHKGARNWGDCIQRPL